MKKELIKKSKFLSLVLRHDPASIGITLDEAGWTDVDKLLVACCSRNCAMTREELEEIVATNEKKRFAFSEDGKQIRASQGHSIQVELGYKEKAPPQVLYHGTASRFLELIMKEGLKKQKRHHIHLSNDLETAKKVGQRHGKPVILEINSQKMWEDGLAFYLSDNGVWLTDCVPPQYLEVKNG